MSDVISKSKPKPAGVLARFVDKVVVITGASDRGIGGAIAERLATEGASLAMLSRSEPVRLRKRIARQSVESQWTPCDITKVDDVRRGIAETVARFGRIDVLINNAGVETAKNFEDFEDSQWHELLDVNLHGAIRATQAALGHFPDGGGVIVNVSSALGLGGCPGFSIYSAAKAGLNGLTQSLAWELGPRRIRVVGVAPALVATPMTLKHIGHMTPEVHARLESIHPLGVGLPHDVSGAVAFLASDDARWVTGVTLPLGWAPQFPLPVDQFMSSEPKPAPNKPR